MFSYARRRLLRGRSAFLALFMSVALATTLFSGILRGADAVDPLTRARDVGGFGDEVRALDPNVEGVDIAETIVRRASENVFLAGPKRVEELGVYFATLVSSLGVVLVVSTVFRSRSKELTVMTIRVFSDGQLAATLLVENMGMTLFSIALGLGVGLVMLRGENVVYNAVYSSVLLRRLVFPPSALVALATVVGLLVLSTVAPILLAVRHASRNPVWRIEE
jgi:hypothetical protein